MISTSLLGSAKLATPASHHIAAGEEKNNESNGDFVFFFKIFLKKTKLVRERKLTWWTQAGGK